MKVRMLVNAPRRGAKRGDVIDVPDSLADLWIIGSIAANVDDPAPVVADTDNVDLDESDADELAEYALGGGWFEINGEKVQGHDAAMALLAAGDDDADDDVDLDDLDADVDEDE